MNKIIQLISLLLLIFLFSCRENDIIGREEGTLQLSVSMQSDLPIISTRATLTDEELKENCKVYVRNSLGLVRKFTTLKEVPNNILLVADKYKVEVIAGDSVPASFKDSYYKGNKEFVLSAGQILAQTVECKIQNTVTCVALASDLAEAFSSYIVTISTRKGKLEYTPDSIGKAGYFMLLSDENQLNWKFEGTMRDGKKITNVGTIKQVKKSFKYMLTFENPSLEVGGGMIQVEVDATELAPQNMEIGLDARPIIQYAEDGKTWVEMDNPAYRALNTSTPITIGGAANSVITSFSIGSEFQRLSAEFPGGIASYDFINMNDKEKENLERLGLTFMLKERDNGGESVSVSFSEALMTKMTETTNSVDGANTYKFDVTIVDSKGKSRNKTLTVITTDVSVATENVLLGDVWAKSAILRGRIIDSEKATNLYFQYKEVGTADWKKLTNNITVKDEICTGAVTGLKPDTKYEYQVVAGDPSVPSPIICTFTTEAAEQLPNWQFEEWSSESNNDLPLLISKDESSMFWDSGNHGSKMGSVNVTTHDETIKKSGRYSAKLSSQKVGVDIGITVIGKFAAGNLFAGKYLGTDGTDGVLRFGRPWVSRPSGFRVWVKYNSAKVNYPKDGVLPSGSQDIASIYIAVGDWKHTSYGGDNDIPVLVKTKSKEFFDPNSSNVIGYGVLDLKGSTQGEEMVLKEVPIIYRSNRIPTDIIAVASASKYGDYFAGGEGSTLWLDDLELIYSDEIEFEK